ncbi:MAG: putative DNA-binding domain-containing protein [Myxococcales bacterium]
MNLAEYQRALVKLSFAPEADERDFEGFEDRGRFVMYRQMIRTRFLGMAKQAFRKSFELLGTEACERSFMRFLAAQPPRSPLIREVIAAFGTFAVDDTELLSDSPVYAADLLRFEEAKWRVAYRKAEPPPGIKEFDFAGIPVFNAALEQLALSHRVHELEDTSCRTEPCSLLVYRPPQIDDIRWYAADPLFTEVLRCARRDNAASLADSSTHVCVFIGESFRRSIARGARNRGHLGAPAWGTAGLALSALD